jgi:outer membrane protein TolC
MNQALILLTLLQAYAALTGARAQTTPQPAAALTLKAAIDDARANYPAIRASLADISAAQSGISLARTAYLPRTDLLLQFNRATRNNVFGLILPNGVIPAISGPVLDESTISSTFGSAAGARFSWEPFDFGLRRAKVGLAESIRSRAQTLGELTELDVSIAAGEAFLSLAAAEQSVQAARANVERFEVFLKSISVLARNQLRPGADESRAKAELARAQIDLIRAEQAREVARATLAEWLGRAGESIEIDAGALLAPAPEAGPAAIDLSRHPLAELQDAEVDVVNSRRRSLEKSYRPRFFLDSAVFGRGTGARVDGTFQGGAHGLSPSEGNWAVGMNITFPVFNHKENRVRQEIERHHETAEAARYEKVLQALRGGVERARAQVESARRIAQNTPVALEAARVLETQARERYRAGLGTVIDVADALRLVRQSEIDDSLARLGVWQAMFALAAAQGDISELVNQASR